MPDPKSGDTPPVQPPEAAAGYPTASDHNPSGAHLDAPLLARSGVKPQHAQPEDETDDGSSKTRDD
jgi:hypothetical protein